MMDTDPHRGKRLDPDPYKCYPYHCNITDKIEEGVPVEYIYLLLVPVGVGYLLHGEGLVGVGSHCEVYRGALLKLDKKTRFLLLIQPAFMA